MTHTTCPECESTDIREDDHVLICSHCDYEWDPDE